MYQEDSLSCGKKQMESLFPTEDFWVYAFLYVTLHETIPVRGNIL